MKSKKHIEIEIELKRLGLHKLVVKQCKIAQDRYAPFCDVFKLKSEIQNYSSIFGYYGGEELLTVLQNLDSDFDSDFDSDKVQTVATLAKKLKADYDYYCEFFRWLNESPAFIEDWYC